MIVIPLRTDAPVRATPLANYALIVANLLVFLIVDGFGHTRLAEFKLATLALDCALPEWWQFFTYQFIHGSIWHLGGNMLFLWVFGNSVNCRFGNLPYVLFYLSAGAFAGWGFAIGEEAPLMGASGSIAAITTAFMVLFPRSHILFLFVMFLITTFELQSLWVILIKIVVWDNILYPRIGADGAGVAYAAHLYGYFYGFVVTLVLLWIGGLSRDQFDLPAVLKRWHRRRTYASTVSSPQAQARARYGSVARPIVMDPQRQKEIQARLDQISDIRARIHQALSGGGNPRSALDEYEHLMMISPDQCLPRQQQLQIARMFYSEQKYPQAAAAFEKFVKHYPKDKEADEARLLLGIIYARDLDQYEAAEGHLKLALDSLTDVQRREQCREWLDRVMARLRSAGAG